MANRKTNRASDRKPSIDWSTARIGWGFGIACMAMGGLVLWATLTAGASGPSGNALRLSQRIVAVLPNSLKQRLALAVGFLMLLGGIFLFGAACYGVYKDMTDRS